MEDMYSNDTKEYENADKQSLVNVTDDREACQKSWFAVLVQMNTEKKVSSQLEKLGIENYVPTQTEIRQWSDRKKKIDRIVIPMVVFVRTDRETEKLLRTYSFVYKFISYPGQNNAAVIPEHQIENLKFMLNHADSKVEIIDKALEVGEEVEVVRGPMKGLSGELCYLEDNKSMVVIRLDLLGCACVNVNKKDIKSKNR